MARYNWKFHAELSYSFYCFCQVTDVDIGLLRLVDFISGRILCSDSDISMNSVWSVYDAHHYACFVNWIVKEKSKVMDLPLVKLQTVVNCSSLNFLPPLQPFLERTSTERLDHLGRAHDVYENVVEFFLLDEVTLHSVHVDALANPQDVLGEGCVLDEDLPRIRHEDAPEQRGNHIDDSAVEEDDIGWVVG